MVFELVISSHEQFSFFIIAFLLGFDKDVFEDAFLGDVHLLDILQYAVFLHFCGSLS